MTPEQVVAELRRLSGERRDEASEGRAEAPRAFFEGCGNGLAQAADLVAQHLVEKREKRDEP